MLRHELAHLALHEALGDLPPRWFDEGYASVSAGEWGREEVIATNLALAWRGVPSLEALEASFQGGAGQASGAYALAHRAVAELAALDPGRGLTLFFEYWRRTDGDFDAAVRSAFGLTQGDFEERWKQRTRRRYGAISLFADLTIGAVVLVVVMVPFYLVRQRRNRERLARMAEAERAAEARERASALEALLRSVGPSEDPRSPP
ncbi:MAG: hypothetical protein HUU26_11270 [Gemmatimonadaceae bacterium]|nr:hypothetical protein [Gemmatimonadaceae bacterium]